jgi:hypothetical protein
MRHVASNRKSRSRGNNGNNGNSGNNRRGNSNRTQVFDSNGPDVRIRGTAHQVHEKYITLARDAGSAGDIVLAESYLQYAEHYQRVINNWEEHVETDGSGLNVQIQQNVEPAPQKTQPVKKPVHKNQPSKKPVVEKEDLSLPQSILGEKVTSDKNLEDA